MEGPFAAFTAFTRSLYSSPGARDVQVCGRPVKSRCVGRAAARRALLPLQTTQGDRPRGRVVADTPPIIPQQYTLEERPRRRGADDGSLTRRGFVAFWRGLGGRSILSGRVTLLRVTLCAWTGSIYKNCHGTLLMLNFCRFGYSLNRDLLKVVSVCSMIVLSSPLG